MTDETRERKLTTGDVVRLRSGGPAMTVVGQIDLAGRMLRCAWFSPGGDDRTQAFPAEALRVERAVREPAEEESGGGESGG